MTAAAKKDIEIVEHAPPLAELPPVDPILSMIERAARDPAVDIEKMRQLLAMRKEAMADEAMRAYSAALAQMQTELPSIVERGAIKVGNEVRSTYAKWDDINEVIKPVLAKHGFALSFRVANEDGKIKITGILSHRAGHHEHTTMTLPNDTSGSKNAVQAVGSSTSYGKRYTAAALLNLTTHGEDDDAQATTEKISEQQMTELVDLCEAVGADRGRFCKYLKVGSLADLPVSRFEEAKQALEAKRGKTNG